MLQVSIGANKQVVEELRGDENMCQALLEIMEPEINKIKAEVTREVTKEGINNTILALRECGQTEDVIKQIISKAYHISFQEAENYL